MKRNLTTPRLLGLRRPVAGDAVVSLLCVVGAVAIAVALTRDVRRLPQPPAAADRVGRLESTAGEVRRRPKRTLVWQNVVAGDEIADADALFVAPRGDAVVRLEGGGRLDVHENSLVVVERSDRSLAPVEVAVNRGTVSGRAEGATLAVRAGGGTAELTQGAAAQIAVWQPTRARVDVLSGAVAVRRGRSSQVVREREAAMVDGAAVAATPGYPLAATAPEPGRRFFIGRTPPAVALEWKGEVDRGEYVEIARGDDEPTVEPAQGRGRHELTVGTPGIYRWRVLDPAQRPASAWSRFTVLLDAAPLPAVPGDRQVVSLPPGAPLLFAWTAVDGVRRYAVEIAPDARFSTTLARLEADAPQLWLRKPLPEGNYAWRVRAVDDARPDAPTSAPSTFHLIHRPLPEAPELLDAVLEMP